MSRVSIVNHAGRDIILTDLSSIEEESEMLEALDAESSPVDGKIQTIGVFQPGRRTPPLEVASQSLEGGPSRRRPPDLTPSRDFYPFPTWMELYHER